MEPRRNKYIEHFNTSIHSKKYQVVHLGTVMFDNNEIPHALLMKFDAKKIGCFLSKNYVLKDITFLISNFTSSDPKIIISKIDYIKDKKKFDLICKIDVDNVPKENPLSEKSSNYFLDDPELKKTFKRDNGDNFEIVLNKGDILDFHITFTGIITIKETPEIECKLKVS